MTGMLLLAAGLVVGFSDTCCQDNYNIAESCYAEALKAAGHHPVMIACNADTNSLREIVRRIDLVVLTGGKDIAPARYGEKPSPRLGRVDLRRDEFEFALCTAAVAEKKPIVGFCRGIQMMNVFFGGTLYQHLYTDFKPPEGRTACRHGRWPYLGGATNPPLHTVEIVPGTRLAAVIGAEPLKTNSHHHQGVKDLAPGFVVSARSTDGFVEAIEHKSYPAVGFQFHPENTVAFRPQTGFDLERHIAMFRRIDELVGMVPVRKDAATPPAENKQAAASAPIRWNFDELGGDVVYDTSDNGFCGVLSKGMKWATGPFGTALAFTGNDSTVVFPEISSLRDPDAFSMSLRARWNGAGQGKYPTLLMSGNWMNGGCMLFVSNGQLLFRVRSIAADITACEEKAITIFTHVPQEKWVHLAVTFERPNLVVYEGGREIGRLKWDHAFPFHGGFTLGKWGGSCCHDGFMDDLRLYPCALSPKEVKRLADNDRYHEIEGYQDDGTGAVRPIEIHERAQRKPIATLDCSLSALAISPDGRVSSLKEKVSGRELVVETVPLMKATLNDRRSLDPFKAERMPNGNFRFHFPAKLGTVEMSVAGFDGGWIFKVEKAEFTKPVTSLEFFRLKPACDEWYGSFLNACSDEDSVVVLRGCERTTNSLGRKGLGLYVVAESELGPLDGWRCAIAAGPRSRMQDTLKTMTIASGVPHSGAGGAWSMGSEGARRSYIFSYVTAQNVEEWIDFAQRGGFSILHFESWGECLGHYPFRELFFPNGKEDFKTVIDKIHGAGLMAGIHTLTACISPTDSWITPVCNTNLFAYYTYTLAEPLTEDSTEVVVNELPGPKHSIVYTYASNGNFLRLGNELVQYTGIRREKPYAFTGLKRGVCGTRIAGTYPAGTQCDYVRNHYIAFYPKPDSPLADELADTVAKIFNDSDLDELYFDGSEGMATRYGTDAMRWKIFSRLRQKKGLTPLCEASCKGANNWWFQSRMGTVDHGVWSAKRFHDVHVRASIAGRKADFIEPQMGWWQPRVWTVDAPGHTLDVMEYFASQNAGIDAAMAIQGVYPFPRPKLGVMNQMTVLGWYERFRLARVFDPELVKAMAVPKAEFRLRQGDDGVWRSTPVEVLLHRAGHPSLRTWNISRPRAGAAIPRFTALYAAAPYDSPKGKSLLASGEADGMKLTSRGAAKPTISSANDPVRGATIRLSSAVGADGDGGDWVRAEKTIPFPYGDYTGLRAFGLWVKGDGSGALLNLSIGIPPEYHSANSDHYVRLDFTGWRYFELLARERDAEDAEIRTWPHSKAIYSVYRTRLDFKHIGSVSLFLSDVAPGKSATVEVSEVRALPVVSTVLNAMTMTVNGERYELPFKEMKSGDMAELDDGVWTRYDAFGEPLEAKAETRTVALRAGDNAISVGLSATGGTARAELDFHHLGEIRAALRALTASDRGKLAYEAMFPFVWAPSKGLSKVPAIAVRPGEKATLQVEIEGPIANPTLTVDGTPYAFDVVIGDGETLICRDGASWKVHAAKASRLMVPPAIKEGKLSQPLPTLGKSARLLVSSADAGAARAKISIVKCYCAD